MKRHENASPELGPDEFTDPLLAIEWGKPTISPNSAKAGLSQELGVASILLTGVEARSTDAGPVEKSFRLQIPVQFKGQLPSDPVLDSYHVQLEGKRRGKVRLGISFEGRGHSFQYDDPEEMPLQADFEVPAQHVPETLVSRVQKLPPVTVDLIMGTDPASGTSVESNVQIETLKAEPSYRWR